MAGKRVNVKGILSDPDLRRKLMVSTIQATQAREGIETSREQADRAYQVVTEGEKGAFFDLAKHRLGSDGRDHRHEAFASELAREVQTDRFDVARRDFSAIPGSPLAYRRVAFVAPLFRESAALDPGAATVKQGLATSDDAQWLREFWEVPPISIGREATWVPFAKGGEFSRFYYDHHLVIKWKDDGRELKDYIIAKDGSESKRIYSQDWYFKPGLTWPRAASVFNVRVLPSGCVFADKGPAVFPEEAGDSWRLLGILNSDVALCVVKTLASREEMGGRWEVGIVKRLPIARGSKQLEQRIADLAKCIHDAKRDWDAGNETSTLFAQPWLLRVAAAARSLPLSSALDALIEDERAGESNLRALHAELNDAVYSLYGILPATRLRMEATLGERPLETLWSQLAGTSTEERRLEHLWRLLSYAVKRLIESDDDGVVPFGRAGGDAPLVDRVRQELTTLFPDHDESQLEVEIVNELKRGAKGYRKCTSLEDWLANAFFEYHATLYRSRPIYWHVASAQGSAPFAFGALVHYHRFDKNRLAKLRASYLRDTIEELRREAGLADKDGRAEDRIELQEKLEQCQALDKKLKLIQEGHLDGPEGGEGDFRILTPWKEPGARPKGWNPDLDDGVRVNIAPLDRAGALRVRGVAG
jgi:hypothetical protein